MIDWKEIYEEVKGASFPDNQPEWGNHTVLELCQIIEKLEEESLKHKPTFKSNPLPILIDVDDVDLKIFDLE